MAGLVSCCRSESVRRRKHSTVGTGHLPASTFTLSLSFEASLLVTQKPNCSLCTCFVFDSFSHQVFSYFLCFLPGGWGPASRSPQQAEPGEAVAAWEWTTLSRKGAFLGDSFGAAGLFSQGFMIVSPPIPRGIWLQLCSPLGLSLLFSQGTALFCSSSSAASIGHLISAPLVFVFSLFHECFFTHMYMHTHTHTTTTGTTMKTPLNLSLSTA